MADTTEVYCPTTEKKQRAAWFVVPTDILTKLRFLVKVSEVLLSLVAFLLEEVVLTCLSCGPLYYFEFISCTAFLFTLLLVILLSTNLHSKVGIAWWPSLDLCYTGSMTLLFLLASIVFAVDNGRSSLEHAAVAFGFLSTLAFFLDMVMFLKQFGIPWKKVSKQPEISTANGKAPPAAPAIDEETQQLNPPATEDIPLENGTGHPE